MELLFWLLLPFALTAASAFVTQFLFEKQVADAHQQ
jgi:hypothetical protein